MWEVLNHNVVVLYGLDEADLGVRYNEQSNMSWRRVGRDAAQLRGPRRSVPLAGLVVRGKSVGPDELVAHPASESSEACWSSPWRR